MTLHIKRVVAAMAAVLTLLTLVPTAALPTIQLPALSEQSAQTTVPADDAAPEEAPEASVTTPDVSVDTPDASATTSGMPAGTIDVSTNDASANHITADKVYGPVTAEDVYTSNEGAVIDQDNTLYVDSDNDGEIEAIKGDVIEDDEDFNTDDLFQDMLDSVTVGKDPVTDESANVEEDSVASQEYAASASGVDLVDGYQNNAYEPTNTNLESHPFLEGGAAWIDLSKIKYGAPASPTYPFTAWSANTSFLNTSATTYDAQGRATEWLFPDENLINSTLWSGANYETAATSGAGYAYNRYDDMQGKWGVTLDKNVSYVEFSVAADEDNDNRYVNLSDTPFLTFSTEHEQDVQISIAVEIGTPTAWDGNGKATAWTYRWYTITDNNIHPTLDDSTSGRMMEPEVQITKKGATSPITDQGYISGAMTGCIDMTHWLPFVNPTKVGDESDLFDVRKVRITKLGDKPARVNYLYFLNQAASILTPQTISAGIDLAADQEIYADEDTDIEETRTLGTSDDYNGWYNGKAFVSYSVTANGYGGSINVSSASGFSTATHSNTTYITVRIPVRKWINVASQARRLAFTIANCSTTKKPVFVLYGNKIGYNSPSRTDQGVSSSDGMLAVIGGSGSTTDGSYSPYLVHKGASTTHCAYPGRIDFDFSYNLDYKGNSNWFDLLDSPYMRKVMAQDGDKAGWVYVSEIQIVMPVGTSFNLGQMTLSNCSDSLNSGRAKSAFDGGTGVQPNVDVSSGQQVTDKAASFGPMLETSNFGTFDLLERTAKGGATGYYGKFIKVDAQKDRYWRPSDTNKADSTKVTQSYYVAYAKTTYNSATWYMIGQGDGSVYWIKVGKKSDGTADIIEQDGSGLIYDVGAWSTSYSNTGLLQDITCDNWSVSPFENGWGAEHISKKETSSGRYYGNLHGKKGVDSETGSGYIHNGFGTLGRFKDLTYMKWNASGQSDNKLGFHYNMSLGRTLSTPLPIKKMPTADGYTNKAPYIRYNFTAKTAQSTTTEGQEAPASGTTPYVKIGLAFEINESTYKIYYLNATDGTLSTSATKNNLSTSSTKKFNGYASLETVFSSANDTVKLLGMHVQGYYPGKGYGVTVNFVNFDVLYERDDTEYHWYDSIKLKDSKVVDNVDVISDAFHYEIANGKTAFNSKFNVYGEKGWTISTYDLDTATSGNQYYVSNYVHKDDTDGKTNTYPTYRPSLDHLRIPVESQKSAKFVLKADRSFPTNNFKYLYISYSVIDDDGVAAADDAGTGILFGIHSQQSVDKGYYMAVSNGSPTSMTYASADLTEKDAYSSSVNAAIDLSKLTSISSVNEFVFYMKNTTPKTTDFYINYLFLSNVPPSDEYIAQAKRTVYHNYYLMDGSGDRYSCRFPTTSNPTGRITSSTAGTENSRVNPLIIKRGDIFYEGTYYNGVPLGKVNRASSTAATSDDSAISLSQTDALKAVWFYQYDKATPGETWAVSDFYKINAKQTTFKSDLTGADVTFDAMWNYNRWLTGWGQQRYLGYNKTAGTVEGTLLQLYATNNNVMLRTGLEPIMYQTTYDTQGGQMVYTGSSGITDGTGFQSGIIENENNYYITQTVVLSHYKWPIDMGDKTKTVNPTKFGYTFAGWYDAPDDDLDAETKAKRIYRYNTKDEPGPNTLYAHWTSDGNTSTYNVYFQKNTTSSSNSKYRWFTRRANRASEFKVTIPWNTKVEISGATKQLYGWKVYGDSSGKVYTPGTTITVTKNVTFLPVTTAEDGTTCTVTLTQNAKLYLHQGGSSYKEITNGYMNMKVTTSGSGKSTKRTYSNIPLYTVVQVKADSTNYAVGSYNWYIVDNGVTVYGSGGTAVQTKAGNAETYKFAVSGDVTISYKSSTATDVRNVWTMPRPVISSSGSERQMMFYSQFNLDSSYSVVECGTLYTKNSQFATLGLTDSSTVEEIGKALYDNMQLNSTTNLTPKTTAVRKLVATTYNAQNQYYLMVTENKGNAVTYYARGYVLYKNSSGALSLRYSPTVTHASVPAVS